MAKKNFARTDQVTDCACVIHSKGYDWVYVERLYNMLRRNLSGGVRLHVYTEHDRSTPPYVIKHSLTEWPGIAGPKRSWWYKMQLFNPEHFSGNLLYFDLDCVIVRDITWITELDPSLFWTIKDFRYLQHNKDSGINSSIMWWNVEQYKWVWDKFQQEKLEQVVRTYNGDQDYLNATIDYNRRRYFDPATIQSFRWEAFDGGMDFKLRRAKHPGAGTMLTDNTSVLVFHGNPKPHEVQDPLIKQHWR